jgi:hypothetical protein
VGGGAEPLPALNLPLSIVVDSSSPDTRVGPLAPHRHLLSLQGQVDTCICVRFYSPGYAWKAYKKRR